MLAHFLGALFERILTFHFNNGCIFLLVVGSTFGGIGLVTLRKQWATVLSLPCQRLLNYSCGKLESSVPNQKSPAEQPNINI